MDEALAQIIKSINELGTNCSGNDRVDVVTVTVSAMWDSCLKDMLEPEHWAGLSGECAITHWRQEIEAMWG